MEFDVEGTPAEPEALLLEHLVRPHNLQYTAHLAALIIVSSYGAAAGAPGEATEAAC
jgi:L-cystine uptake protein TcyP (sodium:dicarboxylate symporter family)